MKNRLIILIIVLIFFSFFNSFGQEVKIFNIELVNRLNLPEFEKDDAFLNYIGKDEEKISFFNQYNV